MDFGEDERLLGGSDIVLTGVYHLDRGLAQVEVDQVVFVETRQEVQTA